MKKVKLASSMTDIATDAPCDRLGTESRYVVIADLRMGDGGGKDELVSSKKALYAILGQWYLPRGYTLVLNGDIEDLRRFWLKDILAAWPEIYAVFDAFREKGRLRKIVGERDLALLRLRSYPYELSHALRIEGDSSSLLVLHGHQASPPFVDRDYLSDYIVHWLGSSKRPRIGDGEENRRERFKAERRLYRAASRLGIIAIQGHTRRPLFESRTNRESVRVEVERLLREGSPRRLVVPCLFSPGRLVGAKAHGMRALRMIELEGDRISLIRWTKARRSDGGRVPGLSGIGAEEEEPRSLEGTPYLRYEIHGASIQDISSRINLLRQD